MPTGKDDEFELCFVPTGYQSVTIELLQWVEPEARLRVGDKVKRLHTKPEVGKAIGKAAAFVLPLTAVATLSKDETARAIAC